MLDLVGHLIEKFFPASGGELYMGGVPVSSVVAECGTPLFIYDSQVLDAKWDLLRRTFPAEFEISYSVKANPNPVILRHFLSKGCGLETGRIFTVPGEESEFRSYIQHQISALPPSRATGPKPQLSLFTES